MNNTGWRDRTKNEYENTCKHGFYVDDCQTCAHLAELGEGPDAEEVRVGSESVDENSSGGATVTAGRGDESVGDERRAEGEERETSSGGGEEVDYGACVYCGERALCHHLVCYCKPCQTTAVCEHSRLKSQCSTHKCKRNCKHNHDRLTCAECNEIELCGHGDTFTPRCRACLFSHPCKEHDVILAECELCEPLENRNWLRQMVLRRERRSLKKWCDEHDVLLVKCTVCKPPAEKDSAQKKSTKQKVSKPPAEQAATQKSNTQQLLNPPTEENSAPTENTKRATNPNEIPQPLPHFRPKCPHNRVPYYCRECGGKGLCVHNKRLYKCMVCGTAKLCEHDKVKYSCKLCSQPRVPKDLTLKRGKWGAILCPHNIPRNRCLECVEKGVCEHKQRAVCEICGAAKMCWHGRIKDRCASCGQGAAETGKCNHGIDKGTSCDRCIEDDKKYLQWRERRRLGAALWRKRQRECTHGIARSQCTECRTTTEAKANKCNHGADKDTSCDECKQEKKKQVLERKRLYGKAYRQKECMHGIARWKCMECRKVWKETKGPKKLSAEQPQADDSQTNDAGSGFVPPPLGPLLHHQQTAWGVGMGEAGNLPVHVQGNAGSGFVPPPSASHPYQQQMTCGMGTAAAGSIPVHVQVLPSPGPPDQMDFGGDDSDDAEDHTPPPVTKRKRKTKAPPSEQPPRVRQKRKSKATNRPSLDQPAVAQSNTGDNTSPPDMRNPPPSDAPATSKHSWGKRGHSVIRPEHVTITGVWKNKLICEHGGDWRRCRVCSPDLFCVHHHRLIYKCKKCRILRMCDVHQKSRDRCKCPVPPGVAEAIESQLPLCAHHQDPHMCQDPVCVEKRQGNPKRVTGKATPGKRGSHRAEVITPTDGQQPAEHPGVSVTDCIICRPHLFCMHQIKRSGCCVCAAEVIAWRRERQRRECQCAHGNAEPACVTCHPLAATCFHGMETRDCGVCMEEREGTAGRNRGDGNIGEEEREEGEAESGRRRHQRVRCEHGWVFACPLCFPALTCQHESIFSACTMCMTSLKKYAVWRGEQVATTERVRPFPGPPDQMDFGGDDSDDAEDHAPPPIPQRKGKATALPSEQPPRVLQHKSKATNRPSLAQPSIAQSNTGDETSPLDTQIPPPSDAPATSKRLDPVNRPEYVTKTGVWENKLVCEHEVNPRRCHVCRPDLFCVHNRLTYGCRKCHILRMCDVHQTSRDRCKCPVPPRVAEVVEIEMPLCAHHQDPHMCQGPVCVEKRQGNPKRVTGKTTLGGKGSHRAEGITPTDDQHPAEHPGVSVTDCIICRPHLFCMHQIKRSGCNICAPEVIAWRRERQRRECQCVHGNAELACVTCHPELAATCFHGMETRDCGVCMEEREGPAGSNRGDGNVGQEEGEGGEGESRQRKYHRVPCEHGQAFACPLCFPALTCQHESTFSACTICMTSLKKYGRWPGERDATKKVGTCQHGNPGKYCIECRPHLGCKHNKISQWCKVCCREIKRWREQKRKKERMCMHGSLEVSCNTCGLELSAVCPHDVAARDCAVCLGEREKKLDSINARCRHRKPPEECVVCMDEGDTEIDSQEEPGGKGGGTGGGANGKGRKQRRAKRKVYHCEHGTVLACPLCFPELVCKHKITFSTCTVCMASLRRSHRWSSGESNIEKKRPAHPRGGRERPLCSEHGQQKNLCIECRPHMGCQHGRFLTKCKTCSKEVRLWREQKWREEHMCMHGCLEISCETCELELNVVCPHDVAARDCAVCLGEREKESELLSRCYHGVPTSECSVCMEERENKDGQTEGEERGEETQTEGEEEERKETQMEGEEGEDGEEERRGKRGGKPFMHRTYRCDHGNLMACPLCCPQLVCMHRVIFSTCTVCMTSLREYRPVVWWGTDRPKEQDTAPTPRITGQRGRRQPPKSWSDYTDSESDTPASLRQLANVHDSLNLATRTQIHLLPLRVRYRAKENGCLNHGATPPMHLHPNG